jgi:hypothetical protein
VALSVSSIIISEGKMERTHVRCYGLVASGVSRIILKKDFVRANSRSLLRALICGIERQLDHYFGGGKMERTDVRCYGRIYGMIDGAG